MKRTFFAGCLISFGLLCPALAQDATLPHLETNGQGQTHLMVDGQPYIMLGGELHNSSTGSAHYMAPIWKRMADMHINTVIAPVTWELLEPVEGQYDFAQLDSMVAGARREGLHLVLLWFGSWKNGMSSYVPAWVKQNPRRFPLVHLRDGQTIAALSTLGTESVKADARAYAAMMRHLKEIDGERHTVLFVQIENEMGTLDETTFYVGGVNRAMRDYSPAANRAFEGQVPTALLDYLQQHRRHLHPAIANVWRAQGYRARGTWEEVFGKGQAAEPRQYASAEEADADTTWRTQFPYLTEELFNVWNYATYVEQIAKAGKVIYPIPTYVNAWIKQGTGAEPGKYPSGGPQPHVFDIWHAAAPHVDLLAPDIYATTIFDFVLSGYDQPGNPVLLPETKATPEGAARAFYAFGKYNMLCYAPFGIDGHGYNLDPIPGDRSYEKSYGVLSHLLPDIARHQGTPRINALYMEGATSPAPIRMGNYSIMMQRFSTSTAQAVMGVAGDDKVDAQLPAGALVIQTGDDEFLVAGGVGGCAIRFGHADASPYHPGQKQAAILCVDEITYDASGNRLLHRVNGDETAFGTCVIPTGEVKTFLVRMYEY